MPHKRPIILPRTNVETTSSIYPAIAKNYTYKKFLVSQTYVWKNDYILLPSLHSAYSSYIQYTNWTFNFSSHRDLPDLLCSCFLQLLISIDLELCHFCSWSRICRIVKISKKKIKLFISWHFGSLAKVSK